MSLPALFLVYRKCLFTEPWAHGISRTASKRRYPSSGSPPAGTLEEEASQGGR